MDLHRHGAVVLGEGGLLVGLHLGSVQDWTRCGTTCEPGYQCQALTERSGFQDRCPKKASIHVGTHVLQPRQPRRQPVTTDGFVRVCGGHFTVHRDGKRLQVVPL